MLGCVIMATAKTEKTPFFERIKRRFRGVIQEMKKVHWPTRQELLKYTIVVLLTCTMVGAFIWIVDFGVSSLMTLLIRL